MNLGTVYLSRYAKTHVDVFDASNVQENVSNHLGHRPGDHFHS
jgi:hypothetical protein